MKTTLEIRLCLLALAVFGLLGSVSAAQDNSAQQSAVGPLIKQLGAATSAERQAAFRKLIEIGPLAVSELCAAIESAELQQKMRCIAVLQRLAVSRQPDVAQQASEAIRRLTDSEDRETSALAVQISLRMENSIKENAIRELLALNAEFSGGTTVQRIRQLERQKVQILKNWSGDHEDLRQLLWLPETTQLNLVGEQVDDEAIRVIAKLPMLSSLRIKDASITNQAINALIDMESLAKLEIVNCPIDDDCLEDLIKIQSLAQLNSYGTKLTLQGIQEAQKKKDVAADFRMGAFLGVNYLPGEGPGCNVTLVVPGSAASEAGILAGDTIVRYRDKPIDVPTDFLGTVSNDRVGDTVPIVVERDGKRLTLTVVMQGFPDREFLVSD